MKQLLASILLLTAMLTAQSQSLLVQSIYETTSIGAQAGLRVGFEKNQAFGYGVFYRGATLMHPFSHVSERANKFYETEAFGVYVSGHVQTYGPLDVQLNMRVGVSNAKNFVLIPSVQTRYNITQFLGLNLGLGVMSFRPTLQGGLSLKLHTNTKS